MLQQQAEVDLHVLVVPESQWRPDLRLAYSSTCMASVSAGFVRVDPDVCLAELREEISRQLGSSTSLPQCYIFLRCVGRYLCTVSRQQELSLSPKLFVPPLAACPEIYLLNASLAEGVHSPLSGPLPTHLPPDPLPGLRLSPHHFTPSTLTSHTAPGSHSHYSPHSTSDDIRRSMKGSPESEDLMNQPTASILLQEQEHGAPTLLRSHYQEYHRGSPQGGAANHPHHQEVPGGGAQPLKNKSVHFGSFTTFSDATPSGPTTTPGTTTTGMELLALSPSGQHSEAHNLLAQIRKVKEESKHLGILKESLSSTIRQLQHKLQARKEKESSDWKQRLDDEKKQTRKLEKEIRKLRAEIEAVDQVTPTKKKSVKKSSARAEQQKDSKSVTKSESDHTNLKLECKRADLDMQQLRKTRDEERQKLKVEQDKHQSIVEECKALKKELKVAQNRLKHK